MKKRWWLGLTGIITIIGYGLLEPYWQKKKNYVIVHKDIPIDFDGFKIVFLADIHFGRPITKRKLIRMVNEVNKSKPDVIILGGDYINKEEDIKECFECLKELKAKMGVYAVHGNHDVVESKYKTQKAIKEAGIISINNDAVWIEKQNKIRIGGVGDLWTEEQDISKTVSETTLEDYVILVTHNPKYVYEIEKEKIDLILAGHTHGGQCKPVRHLGKIVPRKVGRAIGFEYLAGHKNNQRQDVIVSNGIGTAKFPVRIFARPEIVNITLRSAK